jgi:hypothetical protein
MYVIVGHWVVASGSRGENSCADDDIDLPQIGCNDPPWPEAALGQETAADTEIIQAHPFRVFDQARSDQWLSSRSASPSRSTHLRPLTQVEEEE